MSESAEKNDALFKASENERLLSQRIEQMSSEINQKNMLIDDLIKQQQKMQQQLNDMQNKPKENVTNAKTNNNNNKKPKITTTLAVESDKMETEQSDWNTVKNRKRRINSKGEIYENKEEENFANRFEIFKNLKFTSNDNNQNESNSKASTSKNTTQQQKKVTKTVYNNKNFCPPIIFYNASIKNIIDNLGENIDSSSYKIVNINRVKSKLYVDDVKIQKLLIEKLKEQEDIEAHTYTDKSMREVNLILRDVHFSIPCEDIKEELTFQCPNTKINKVDKFYTAKSVKQNIKYNLHLVQLEAGQSIDEILNVKYVLGQRVFWERPKSKGIVQCKRCQSFGHIAKNCARNYKCVKCNDKHGPGECKVSKSVNSVPYCVNCKTFGHPANWRGCKTFEDYTKLVHPELVQNDKSKNISKPVQVSSEKHISQIATSSTSYASVLKKNRVPTLTENSFQRNSQVSFQSLETLQKLFLIPNSKP
jgi:hypothetical protein